MLYEIYYCKVGSGYDAKSTYGSGPSALKNIYLPISWIKIFTNCSTLSLPGFQIGNNHFGQT